MTLRTEGDTMTCRACGRDQRASEGRMCADCGTFICVHCSLKGVERCKTCTAKAGGRPA